MPTRVLISIVLYQLALAHGAPAAILYITEAPAAPTAPTAPTIGYTYPPTIKCVDAPFNTTQGYGCKEWLSRGWCLKHGDTCYPQGGGTSTSAKTACCGCGGGVGPKGQWHYGEDERVRSMTACHVSPAGRVSPFW